MDATVLTVALLAGVLATFNPCGFALLPAYLTLVASTTEGKTRSQALLGGMRFAAGMTLGFVLVFGTFGLLISPFTSAIQRYLPILTIVLGIALIGVGIWLITGRSTTGPKIAIRGWAPGTSWWSQIGYGITFALVSLSCTIGPFLAVTGTALRSDSIVNVVVTFLVFGLGMGAAVLILAIATTFIGSGLTQWLRTYASALTRITGVLVLLAGVYVAWFGWYEWRILQGTQVDDPVIGAVAQVQARLTQFLAAIPPSTLLAIIATIVIASTALAVYLGRRSRHRQGA
jgi:cytochrome c-type biogenesis protein